MKRPNNVTNVATLAARFARRGALAGLVGIVLMLSPGAPRAAMAADAGTFIATLGWALVYGLRFSVQWLLYDNDQPELLALAKMMLGWPVTAVAVVLTVRAVRAASADR